MRRRPAGGRAVKRHRALLRSENVVQKPSSPSVQLQVDHGADGEALGERPCLLEAEGQV